MDAAGDLFGTTVGGGANGDGTVFEVPYINGSYASTPTVLASFNGTDGSKPEAVMIADAAGDLFGTTIGGLDGDSTVFEIVKTGGSYASTPTVLASFSGGNGTLAGLLADSAGDLFGTTEQGGTNCDGTVFELTDTGFQLTPPVPPVLSGGGNNVTYTSAGAPVAIDSGLGVSDTSSAVLAGATVSIGVGFLAGDIAELRRPERHLRSLRRHHRRADFDGQRKPGRLSGGPRVGHLQLDPHRSVEFRCGSEPDGQLDRDRRRAVVQYHHQCDRRQHAAGADPHHAGQLRRHRRAGP